MGELHSVFSLVMIVVLIGAGMLAGYTIGRYRSHPQMSRTNMTRALRRIAKNGICGENDCRVIINAAAVLEHLSDREDELMLKINELQRHV